MNRSRFSFFTTILLIIMLVFGGCGGVDEDSVWDGEADTSWYNASNNSFTISKAAQLAGMAKLLIDGTTFSGKTITLTNNIDLAGIEWTPIGFFPDGYSFLGVFNGGGHTISNMTIEDEGTIKGLSYVGLFGYINSVATVKNINLTNVHINVSSSSFACAGSIAGGNEGTISNCTSNGNVITSVPADLSVTSVIAGGAVGYNTGAVSNCAFNGGVSATVTGAGGGGDISLYGAASAGGIVGANTGKISNCTSNGSVSTSGHNGGSAGGIVGASEGNVSNCESNGSVSASSYYKRTEAGGIAGANGGAVTNCNKPTGSVKVVIVSNESTQTRSQYEGGIIGYLEYSSPHVISGNTYNKTATGQQWGIGYDDRITPPGPSDDV